MADPMDAMTLRDADIAQDHFKQTELTIDDLMTIAKPIVKGAVRSARYSVLKNSSDNHHFRFVIEQPVRIAIIGFTNAQLEDGSCAIFLRPTDKLMKEWHPNGGYHPPFFPAHGECDLAVSVWFDFYTDGEGNPKPGTHHDNFTKLRSYRPRKR